VKRNGCKIRTGKFIGWVNVENCLGTN